MRPFVLVGSHNAGRACLHTRIFAARELRFLAIQVPCVAELAEHGLTFHHPITFLVGENGSGKSTIVEALAETFKFDDRGGRNLGPYATNRSKTPLGSVLRLDLTARGSAVLRGPRSKRRGFFLRAETAFGLMDAKSGTRGYWDENTSEMSHGESFFTVFSTMFQDPLLYLMDEPEAGSVVHVMPTFGRTHARTRASRGADHLCYPLADPGSNAWSRHHRDR